MKHLPNEALSSLACSEPHTVKNIKPSLGSKAIPRGLLRWADKIILHRNSSVEDLEKTMEKVSFSIPKNMSYTARNVFNTYILNPKFYMILS